MLILSGWRSLPARQNRAEGQINTWGMYCFGWWQPVQPVRLRGAFHHQQATVLQHPANGFPGLFVFKGKLAISPQTQRANGTMPLQILFCITVPRHAFTAIMIQVKQAGVVGFTTVLLYNALQCLQHRYPGQRGFGGSGIGIGERAIRIPSHFPFGKNGAAADDRLIRPPWDCIQQPVIVVRSLRTGQDRPVVIDRAVNGQQIAWLVIYLFQEIHRV